MQIECGHISIRFVASGPLQHNPDSGVRQAIKHARAEIAYLPLYSPDLNPIETIFSKFKWTVRSQAQRSLEALWELCGHVIDQFQESDRETTSNIAGTATLNGNTL